MNPETIFIVARRWFRASAGNTYFTAVCFVHLPGGRVERIELPYQYGYGDQYAQSAADAIERAGFMPDRKHYPNGGGEQLSEWCRARGIDYTTDVTDVPRKRDLHNFSRGA